jgi:hypothetical protein
MTPDPQEDSVVAIYESHYGAEAAIRSLQQAGLDMKRLSIVAKDDQTGEHAVGFYTSDDRMKFWAVRAGRFLVLARGTPDMIVHARVVLGTSGASLLMAHPA